ncbi:MAG: RNA methyltransferase [Myxococcales bacterium]|nr:RNA methyltransferase [Myxococcales bacterium]
MSRASRVLPWVGGAVLGSMLCAGLLSPLIVPANWTERNVPPHLRADRWELSDEGMRARSVTEAECGALPHEVWLDFPDHADEPSLERGAEALTDCFASKVAPRFARDRFE